MSALLYCSLPRSTGGRSKGPLARANNGRIAGDLAHLVNQVKSRREFDITTQAGIDHVLASARFAESLEQIMSRGGKRSARNERDIAIARYSCFSLDRIKNRSSAKNILQRNLPIGAGAQKRDIELRLHQCPCRRGCVYQCADKHPASAARGVDGLGAVGCTHERDAILVTLAGECAGTIAQIKARWREAALFPAQNACTIESFSRGQG